MNIRRTLVSLLSTIVVTLTMLGIVLINAQTSDEEPDLSYRTLTTTWRCRGTAISKSRSIST